MSQEGEEAIRRAYFQKVAFSSYKKLVCGEGELTLTLNRLLIDCKNSWSRSFPIDDIRLEGWDNNLEVREFHWGRLLFRLIIGDAEEWANVVRQIQYESAYRTLEEIEECNRKKPEELDKLFDIEQVALRGIVKDIRKKRLDFGQRNINFILGVQELTRTMNNRKLKAFILAHCYIAWYDWEKNLLLTIYKWKYGKGPNNDEELIKFFEENFPSLGILNTRELGIKANQLRNCIAHEKFYYDYRCSELVLMVTGKLKRIPLREMQRRFLIMTSTYSMLIQSLKLKVDTGKIHYGVETFFTEPRQKS